MRGIEAFADAALFTFAKRRDPARDWKSAPARPK
jgi:hypothetical protein